MKKIVFILAMATAVLSFSCCGEKPAIDTPEDKTTITVSVNGAATYTTEIISMVETNDLIINSIPAEGATITVKTKEKNGFNITGDTYFTCTWTGWYDRIFTIKPNTSGEPVEFNIAMWDNDNPDDIRMLVTFKQGK